MAAPLQPRPDSLTNLTLAKRVIDYDGTLPGDEKIILMIEDATGEVYGYCRNTLKLSRYVEKRNYPVDTNILYLWHRPLVQVVSVKAGTKTLVKNDDYIIDYNNSRLFIFSMGDAKYVEDSLEATYDAGLSEYVITPFNNKLDFKIPSTSAEFIATLTEGRYDAVSLASQIQTQMRSAGGSAGANITCVANTYSATFTIATTVQTSFSLLISTGTNGSGGSKKNLWETLGFTGSADKTGALTYTSDEIVIGVPSDLQRCFNRILRDVSIEKTSKDTSRLRSESVPGGGTRSYSWELAPDVKEILDRYTEKMIG